jgi:hypothetical protein
MLSNKHWRLQRKKWSVSKIQPLLDIKMITGWRLEESQKNEIQNEDPKEHYATKKLNKPPPPISRGGAMESG